MMKWNTPVDIPKLGFLIQPFEEILFVGSCFADSIGRRFQEEQFLVTVNPFGTMYNPASVLHTIERTDAAPRVAFVTLGTNHVYMLKATGEIVDNCQKRPAKLFDERELSVDECAEYLCRCVEVLRQRRPDVHVVFTVSPIRYAKYGFHASQLSKATLLLAIEKVINSQFTIDNSSIHNSSQHESPSLGGGTGEASGGTGEAHYFPSYEIVLDELRDYRFYAPDMLHLSEQAVDYIFQRLTDTCFSDAAKTFMEEWRPIKDALRHRPFNTESEAYQTFMEKTKEKIRMLKTKYPEWKMKELL